MHRFFLRTQAGRGAVVVLDEGNSHHASRVLRLREGDPIEILDGSGRCLGCRVVEIDKRAMRAEVMEIRVCASPARVTLAPTLIKGKAMDFLVQKATELGVTGLRPVVTERSVVRVSRDEADAWVEPWRQTAIEACKQCGNPWMPEIRSPVGLPAFLSDRPAGLLLVASLRRDARWLKEILDGVGKTPWTDGVTLVLGPEGDFTEAEEESLRSSGAVPMTLGPLVLRAETAAVAGLAVIQHALAGRGAV